jgi:hypothetical protein
MKLFSLSHEKRSIIRGLFLAAAPGRYYLAGMLLYLFSIVVSGQAQGQSQKCPARWIDSLVFAGIRSLDSGNVSNANRYFTIAYRCGMSKDSMLYFAAELYMRSMALDTALTFNWGVEKSAHLPRSLYLEQRSRIFRLIGWTRQADSLLALLHKKVQLDFSLNVSGSRNILALNPIMIPPKSNLIFKPNDIIDDAGNAGIYNKLSLYNNSRLRRFFFILGLNGDFKLPTRYSYTDETDTILRSVALYAGVGELPFTPECMLGHRWAVHPDSKTDHFDKIMLSFPIKKDGYLSLGHDIKWTENGVEDDRTDLQFSRFTLHRKLTWLRTVSLSHHYSNFNQFENKVGSSGIFSMIPVGYVDSLPWNDSTEMELRYYYDQSRRLPSTEDYPEYYWAKQSGMRFLIQPEHDLNLHLKSSLTFTLPFKIGLNLQTTAWCSWYPDKVCWYTIPDSIKEYNFNIHDDYAIIYDASNGKYYLYMDRKQVYFNKDRLVELNKHEKTRIDFYFSMVVSLEKEVWKIGTVYFSAQYLKRISSLPEKVPLISLNQNWELQAGWKKDISIAK